MTRTTAHNSIIVGLLAVGMLATACSTPVVSTSPVASEEPSASTYPSFAPSVAPSAAPSIESGTVITPSFEPASSDDSSAGPADGAEGIALADVNPDLLMSAFTNYGFTFGDLIEEGGDTYYSGEHADYDAEFVVVVDGDSVRQTNLYDYSAGEAAAVMGFAIGIFAPESQQWLVEQLNAATESPGTDMTVEKDFDYVTLEFNAFTDDSQSIDLIVK